MLKSMTAYARASVKKTVGRFVVEIQSVNRKFLEVNTMLPQELFRFDGEIKNLISDVVSRGQVTVKLFAEYDDETPVSVKPNLPLVRQIKNAFDSMIKELDIQDHFTLDLLKDEKKVLLYTEEFKNEEEYLFAIKEVMKSALSTLLDMKIKEGNSLLEDIQGRVNKLQKSIEQIEVLSPECAPKLREKLIAKLNEVMPGFIENEERVLREVCLFAEKVDIAEEITRFKSHIQQFTDLLNSKSDTIGKTLEFLTQEMNREINTIGSKAAHIEITKQVIEVKAELERIKEQIQNVE